MILVTGGAGFIGLNFVLDWFRSYGNAEPLITLDALKYAGNRGSLLNIQRRQGYRFVAGDIRNSEIVRALLAETKPRAIIHFAAETHVDRSIKEPSEFIHTNILGTFNLLEESRTYWSNLPSSDALRFRFLHVSTDEVYGDLHQLDPANTETTPFRPNNPYAASKAAGDHLVRAWHHTYGLPVITTHCSNNYGPYQFPEKLIPLTIANALAGKPIPIYGDGLNVRDWLYVSDHCSAIRKVLESGATGEVYNICGYNQMSNIEIVRIICNLLDIKSPHTAKKVGGKHEQLITHIKDRLGHDRRYAINASKITRELGWKPIQSFQAGITKTVDWYLANRGWLERVLKSTTLSTASQIE